MNDVAATLSNGLWPAGDIVKNVELGFHQYSVSSGWVGSLEGFNNRSPLMIRSSSHQSLSIGGIPVDPAATPIGLKGHRWHYISYLPLVSMTVTDALAGSAASEGEANHTPN